MIFESPSCFFLLVLYNLAFNLLTAPTNHEQYPTILPFEILINEIMADPVPQIGLPECEYIEIYNRGSRSVDLTGCILCIGNHLAKLPAASIRSGEYIIICDDSDEGSLGQFGATLALEVFPPVLNTGQIITLKDSCRSVIHSVIFKPEWYDLNPDGGRALELVDPENPCGRNGNWLSSKHSDGGTPGSVNSVYGSNPDLKGPVLVRATLPSESEVLLNFNESLHPATLAETGYYSVNNGMLHPEQVTASGPEYSKISLHYGTGFQPGILYTVSVLNQLKDCAGNTLQENAFVEFAIPERCQSTDIIINEILFDGSDSKTEFIELYNRSDKTLDLAGTSLSLADYATGHPVKTIPLSSYPFLLLPGHYVVLTDNDLLFMEKNPDCPFQTILEIPGLFKLPDQEGMIVLTDTAGLVLDEFVYSYEMHLDLLNDQEGISLERIEPGIPSSDRGNWMSASSIRGYSTPGRENSQFCTASSLFNLSVSPEFLSPDDDGLDDFITLHLTFDLPGWMGSMLIYDLKGRIIKTIFSQSLVGTDECFIWDGKNQEGKIVDAGFYIIYGEFFSLYGKTKNFKKVIPVIKK